MKDMGTNTLMDVRDLAEGAEVQIHAARSVLHPFDQATGRRTD